MTSVSKRVLTDEKLDFDMQVDYNPSGTPEDLRARLRSVGSRVRKSVTEGYRTMPSSFSKAQSTNTIFQSSSDTLREIYFNRPFQPTPSESSIRKRTRESGYHSDGGEEDDGENTEMKDDTTPASRPIKALRKPRKTPLSTRSLPNGQLSFGMRGMDEPMAGLEEEDWSLDAPSSSFPAISVVEPTEDSMESTSS